MSLIGKAISIGWDALDTLLTIANPAYGIYRAAGGRAADDPGARPLPGVSAVDPTKSDAYQQAQASLAAAQARQAASQAALQSARSQAAAMPIQVTVPSFALPGNAPSVSTLVPPPSITGDLCGFYGLGKERKMSGYHILGALKSKKSPYQHLAKKPAKKAPATGKSHHKLALKNAEGAAKAALAAGTHAVARGKQFDPAKHKPIVPLVLAAVHGRVIGVSARSLTPAQQQAVQKHANAIARHARAATVSKQRGERAIAAAKDLTAYRAKAAPIIDKLLKHVPMGSKAAMHGIVGIYDEIIGMDPELLRYLQQNIDVFGADANGLNPGDPGYDPSTDSGAGADTGSVSTYDPSQDPNIVELPQRDQPFDIGSAAPRHVVPDDGVTYKGERGWPDQGFASQNRLQGKDGFEWHQDGWYAYRSGEYSRETPSKGNAYGGAYGWGPPLSNPNGPVPGLQYAMDTETWFWDSANAPSWATIDQDNALKYLNQKTATADKAAADADAARQAQDEAAMQEAQAKQDAANALAQSAADTQSQIAEQQQAAQQAQLDIQQQQAEQQQAAQAAQQDLEARQIQLDYLKAHPEALDQGDAGGGDAGGDAGGDTGDAGDAGGDAGGDYWESRPAFGPGPDDPFANIPYPSEEGQ